jgi:hypothetical protein
MENPRWTDPDGWDNRRPSDRQYNEAEHAGRKRIRMDVFKGTERLGAVTIRAEQSTLELTIAIEETRKR